MSRSVNYLIQPLEKSNNNDDDFLSYEVTKIAQSFAVSNQHCLSRLRIFAYLKTTQLLLIFHFNLINVSSTYPANNKHLHSYAKQHLASLFFLISKETQPSALERAF